MKINTRHETILHYKYNRLFRTIFHARFKICFYASTKREEGGSQKLFGWDSTGQVTRSPIYSHDFADDKLVGTVASLRTDGVTSQDKSRQSTRIFSTYVRHTKIFSILIKHPSPDHANHLTMW